ncbi:MAG: hypothetical protein ACUVSY_00010 [Roseiflexus sp.]
MLRIYIADDCPGSRVALRVIESLRFQMPDLPIEVVNLSRSDVQTPSSVFGTPVYMWNDRVLFLGNPDKEALLECVRGLYDRPP